jgi:Ca2+-binding RTX toxin-like protein
MSSTYSLKPFRINLADLNFIKDQINFKPLFDIDHNAIINWDGTGNIYDANGIQYDTTGNAANDLLTFGSSYASLTASQGLRDVTGLNNNLLHPTWGAADQPFMQRIEANFNNYVQTHHAGDFGSFYANQFNPTQTAQIAAGSIDYTKTASHAGGNIVDYTPRMISQLVTTGDAKPLLDGANHPMHWYEAQYSSGLDDIANNISSVNATYAAKIDASGVNTATLLEGAFIITDYGMLESLGQRDPQNPDNGEFFIGATNPGVAPGNSWLALFGQFFDHGLDFIGKGGDGTKIKIPLATTDPMYGVINPTTGQPATSITISRANVSGFDAQGNAQWVNHTSPYIDQSQTYGSSEQMTQLLRKWVDVDGDGDFSAGSELLDGSTSVAWKNGFGEMTNATLPTLNELRAHLLATGRDDLTWDDVSDLRNRDANGQVTTGLSGQALLLDMNPVFNESRFTPETVSALQGLGILPDGNGNYALGGPGASLGTIIDFQTFSPRPAYAALAGEVLLESVGNHYIAGDGRVNENIGLTTIHHVFHEEHNYQVRNIKEAIEAQDARAVILGDSSHSISHDWQDATAFQDANGNYLLSAGGAIAWNEEKLFNAAKLTVEMEYQHTAVDQYARTITPDLPEFVGYNSGENGTVSLEYAQVAFRFGHSTIRETIDVIDPAGGITGKVMSYALEQSFLNPGLYASTGAAAIALGLTHQQMNEIDEFVTPALNQGLLGQPLDLAAINIARGRDIGIPTLNEFRVAVGLTAYTSWSDFGANMIHADNLVNFIAAYSFDGDVAKAQLIIDLESGAVSETDQVAVDAGLTFEDAVAFLSGDPAMYGSDGFDKIDTWVGGLAEAHVSGGLLGETFNVVFLDQIQRLMDGDRFYYLYRLNNMNLGDEIANAQFKDLIERNTGLEHLNGSAFAYADQYFDLSQNVSVGGDFKTEHKYGAQIDLLHLGIYSDGGSSTNANGNLTTVGGQQYIRDVRTVITPNATNNLAGAGLDGNPDSGVNSNEVIVATDNKDFIYARGGDDTVYGEAGDDIIYGGGGIDRLYGGDGNDIIHGEDGGDLIDGGAGDDILYGESSASSAAGVDQIIGAGGNDIIFGGVGIDKLSGGSGDDVIYGGSDTDAFTHGGDGNDYVDGQSDGDLLWGDDGDDLLVGGNNQDIVAGLDGDDILRPGNPSSAMGGGPDEVLGGDGVSDFGNGGVGVGFDLIDLSDYAATNNGVGVTADFATQTNPLVAVDGSTPFPAWVGIEGFIGSRNNDTAIGDDNNNWLIGGSGNDRLTGGAGNDVLIGDGIRLDSLIGTYGSGYTNTFDEATHRAVGFIGVDARNDASTTNINGGVNGSNGLLNNAALDTTMFDKHFTEMLKSEMFQNLELGNNVIRILPNTMGGGTTGDGGTVGLNDIAVFSEDKSNYDISIIAFTDAHGNVINALKVNHARGSQADGVDLLVGIEKAVFAGVEYSVLSDVNYSPVGAATAVLAAGTEDIAYTVTAANLLAGFADSNVLDVLTVHNLSVGTNGSVIDNLDGTYTITPTANYNGLLTLSYSVEDGHGGTIAATQHVTLAAVNDATLGTVNISPTTPNLLQTMTASNNLTDVDGAITQLGYQWQTSADLGTTWIAVGTGNTYTTVAADGNKQIRVVESYRVGTSLTVETVASAASAVQNFITITGTNGIDTVTTLSPLAANLAVSHHIFGLDGNDALRGGSNADILDGGTGNDNMQGLGGSDTYIVDSATDVVIEVAGTVGTAAQRAAFNGIDTVLSSAATYILAANVENLTLTGALGTENLNGTGNALDNTIIGNDGHNAINGGAGADAMSGGLGNDTYTVDNLGDVVTESLNAGIDTVSTTLDNYVLLANLENLTMTGVVAITGSGNELDNIINGNGMANILFGGDGNDTLNGGTGIDTLNGGNGNDTFNGGTGNDVVNGDAGNDLIQHTVGDGGGSVNGGTDIDTLVISGTAAANTLNVISVGTTLTHFDGSTVTEVEVITSDLLGVGDNDTLSYSGNTAGNGVTVNLNIGAATGFTSISNIENVTGGDGNDTLISSAGVNNVLTGGAGDDTFSVHDTGDTISEGTNGGTDLVQFASSISGALFTITDRDVENLTLLGTAVINGTGNAGNNTITGNSADNTLNAGTAGTDSLVGGAGNDTYVIDHAGVTVIETATGAENAATHGIDSVQSTVNTTLSDNVENLTLAGIGNINGTGNGLDNVIVGNTGNNALSGGAGVDTINGGDGTDTITGGAGQDTLTGGAGKDTFVYGPAIADTGTTAATRDIITDFETVPAVTLANSDMINVNAIDANTGLFGNQNFVFTAISGTAAFTAAGQIRYEYIDTNGDLVNDATLIQGNVDNNLAADFSIQLSGLHVLGTGNFVL